jgi:hypothetical protein
VGTPVEMPDGMITSERRNPVMPRASRLMTTPEMIWFTWRLTESRAWRSEMRPPVSTATPTESQRAPVPWASPMRA